MLLRRGRANSLEQAHFVRTREKSVHEDDGVQLHLYWDLFRCCRSPSMEISHRSHKSCGSCFCRQHIPVMTKDALPGNDPFRSWQERLEPHVPRLGWTPG